MKSRAVVTGVLALVLIPSRSPAPGLIVRVTQPTEGQQAAPAWSAPTPFPTPTDGSARALRFASSAASSAAVFVAGNDMPSFFQVPTRPWPLIVTKDGKSLPAPPAAGPAFIQPRVVVASDGMLALLWTVPSADEGIENPLTWLSPGSGGVWAAEFRESGGWSQPARLIADSVQWSKAYTDGAATAAGLSFLAIPASARDASPLGIHALIRREGTWSASRIMGTRSAVEASAAIADGRLYVLYVGSEQPDHGPNSLYVVTSDDQGRSWGAPSLVLAAGRQPIRHPRLRVSRKGVIGFFSRATASGRQAVGMFRLAGNPPVATAPNVAEVAGSIQSLRVALDRCDTAHLVYEDYVQATGVGALTYVSFGEAGWTRPTKLFEGWRAIDPALSIAGGTVFLHFISQPADSPSRSPYASFEARYRTGCTG
jgi:hypothetical protein